MNVQQISRFIEFRDSSWKIARVLSEDQESITFTYSGKDFQLKKSDPKCANFRKNTERLEGADWVLNNENFLYFDLVIGELTRMISSKSLETQDFEIISGLIYFAFYQMIRLNFDAYQNFIQSFESVVNMLYDLLGNIFSDQNLWFAEKNDSEIVDGMRKINTAWQELVDISKVLGLSEDPDNDYICHDINISALDVLKRVRDEKAEYFIEKTFGNVFSGKICLRHIYSYSSWLKDSNYLNYHRRDLIFMDQLRNLNSKKIQFYNPQITYDIIVLLRKISSEGVYDENEVLLVNLEFMRLSEKLFVKIDIVKFVVKIIDTCRLNWSELGIFKDFAFLSLTHESLVKISGRIFEVLIKNRILDMETLKVLTSSIKENIIFEEYADMISYFGYLINSEIKCMLFLKMINGSRTKFKNAINRLGLAIIKDDINHFIQLIRENTYNSVPTAQVVAEILSSQGPAILIYKFVTEITGVKMIDPCILEILRRTIQNLPDNTLSDLNSKQILSTVLYLSESSFDDQKILQETILILERYLKTKSTDLQTEVEHFINFAKTGMLGLEKICDVAIHGHLDKYIDQVFIELSSKANEIKENLPTNFNKAFLYCFKTLNRNLIEQSENFFYFRNGEFKGENEFYKMLVSIDLKELEDEYMEIASQMNVFYSDKVLNVYWSKNLFLKFVLENMKANLLIKLVKNMLFLPSSLGKEITLKCVYQSEMNFEINIGEESTYSSLIYEISKNINTKVMNIICYCEDKLITSSTRIIDLKDKIINIIFKENRFYALDVQNSVDTVNYFNHIIEKLIAEGFENAVYKIIQEKEAVLELPDNNLTNYYWMLYLHNNKKSGYGSSEHEASNMIKIILNQNTKPFLIQMILCILSYHNTGIKMIGQHIENLSDPLISLLETCDSKLLDGFYPNDLYYKIFEFMDAANAIIFFEKLFDTLIFTTRTNYTSAISENLFEMIYLRDDCIDNIKKFILLNVKRIIPSMHFSELLKFYSFITFNEEELKVLHQSIWSNIDSLEEQEYDKHKKSLADGLELLKNVCPNKLDIEFKKLIFQKLFDDFSEVKILYRSELTRSNAIAAIIDYLLNQPNLKNLEDYYDKFTESLKIYPKNCVNLIRRISPKMKGIKNFGSTCYINSTLHLLFSIEKFKQSLIQKEALNDELSSIQYMFQKLEYSILNPINSRRIISNFLMFEENINPVQQMDATEFLNHLFDKLSKENLDSFFKIGLRRSISCCLCHNLNIKNEESYLLQLEVIGNTSLHDCLNKYIDKEMMIQENKYYCEHCQSLQDAEKSVEFSSLPENLFIAFTRFQYDPNKRKMVTINNECLFYNKLKLNQKKYRLKGIVIHIGNEEGGHYIALVNNKGTWLRFNDGKIEEIHFDKNNIKYAVGSANYKENVNINPYILLYHCEESDVSQIQYKIPEEISNKNHLAQYAAILMRADFNIELMIKLIENDKVDFMVKILITTFFSSDCTEQNKINVLKEIYKKFSLKRSPEFCTSFTNNLCTWKEKIIMLLAGNFLPGLREYIKKLFVFVFNSDETFLINIINEYIQTVILFKHSSYNFTLLIEILCELIPFIPQENAEVYVKSIIIWMARDSDAGQNQNMTRLKFSSPTNFSSFYELLTNNCYADFKTDFHSHFHYLCGIVKYSDEVDNFAKIIVNVYPFEQSDYAVLANAIFSSSTRLKISIIVSVFGNVNWSLDEKKQEEIQQWILFLFQNMENENAQTLLQIILSFTNVAAKYYLIGNLKNIIEAKIIEFKRAPGNTFQQSIEKMSEIVNECNRQLLIKS